MSRGLGDVYKRQLLVSQANMTGEELPATLTPGQQVMVSWSRDVMVPLVEER